MMHPTITLLAALASTLFGPSQAMAQEPRPGHGPRTASGRVTDVLGEPIPAATVQLVSNDRTIARTATDAEGIYHLGEMPEAGADLHIAAAGKAGMRLTWRGPTTPTVRHVTLEDATRLEGRVFDSDGRPVADAQVVAVCANGRQSTVTGASGRFAFEAVPLRQVCLRVIGPRSYVQRSLRLVESTECELRLPATGAILRTVRVTGLPPAALDLAFVRVTSPGQALLPDAGRIPLQADGSAELMLDEWSLVEPVVPGFTSEPAGMLALGGGSTLGFRLVAERPGANTVELTGTVRSTARTAVGNQRLVVRDRSHRDLASGVLDRMGNFRIRVELPPSRLCHIGMPLGEWELIDDDRRLRDGFSWVPVDDSSRPIELVAQRTGQLHCPVSAADGSLLALAEVVVADPQSPFRTFLETACDRSGLLRVALPLDRYELLAVAHDGTVCTGEVRFGRPGRPPVVKWRTIATGSVSGSLVDAKGKAMPGVELYLASTDIVNVNEVHAAQRQHARVRTDREGRFRCRGLPEGEWTVVALDEEAVPAARASVRADRDSHLELRRAPR